MKRITYMGSRYSYWVDIFISFWAIVFNQMIRQILIMTHYCPFARIKICQWSFVSSGSNRNYWKHWKNLMPNPDTAWPKVLPQTIASSGWVSDACWGWALMLPAVIETKVPWSMLCMTCVAIAEKAVCSGGHHCYICYHGDPVKLGECTAGWPDWVAVFLSEKQEAVRVTSRSRHP